MVELTFNSNLTYCPETFTISQPLEITNPNDQQQAFKVKTNHKNLVSMYINHGFIKPYSTISIPVKIVEKFDEKTTIKLEINWCKPSKQMKQANDSKMTSISKQLISKKVFAIQPKVSCSSKMTVSSSDSKKQSAASDTDSIYESVYQTKKKPTEQVRSELVQSSKKQNQPQKSEVQKILEQSEKQKLNKSSSFKTASSVGISGLGSMSPNKNLQIVSEQDEQDHQKQIQALKSQQIEERRRLDQVRYKIKKIQEAKSSSQFIDFKLLLILMIISFIVGFLIKAAIL